MPQPQHPRSFTMEDNTFEDNIGPAMYTSKAVVRAKRLIFRRNRSDPHGQYRAGAAVIVYTPSYNSYIEVGAHLGLGKQYCRFSHSCGSAGVFLHFGRQRVSQYLWASQ